MNALEFCINQKTIQFFSRIQKNQQNWASKELIDYALSDQQSYAVKQEIYKNINFYAREFVSKPNNSEARQEVLMAIKAMMPEPSGPLSVEYGDIVSTIREFIRNCDLDRSRHDDSMVNVQWDGKTRLVRRFVEEFNDPREYVFYAQSAASGFDHRYIGNNAGQILRPKIQYLMGEAGVNPLLYGFISDSPFCTPYGLKRQLWSKIQFEQFLARSFLPYCDETFTQKPLWEMQNY